MAGNEQVQILLCCFLWAHPVREAGLKDYEDRVLALVDEHGGTVIQRAIADGEDGRPNEVQLLRFASHHGLDLYLANPRRLALASERDRVVARTEVFPIELI